MLTALLALILAVNPMPTPSRIYASASTSTVVYERYGQITFNNALYAFLPVDNTFAPPNSQFGIYKSTDDGVTWTQQDSAKAINTAGKSKGIYYPGTGNLVYIAFIDFTSRDINLVTFDMATDTWGAIVTGGPHETGSGSNNTISVWPVVLSDGVTWAITYNSGNATFGAPTNIKLVTYNGAWGAPVTANTEGASATWGVGLCQVILDTSDRVHIWYGRSTSGTNTDLYYNNFIANAIGASQLISAAWLFGVGQGQISTGPGIYNSATDELIFAAQKWNGVTSRYDIEAIHGTPSAAPTFTFKLISATTGTDFQDAPGIVRSALSGSVGVNINGSTFSKPYYYITLTTPGSTTIVTRCFWVWLGDTVNDNKVFYSEYDGVNWGAEQTLWDRAIDPLVPDFADYISWISPNSPTPAAPVLPTTTPGDGGRKKVAITPNQFDFCLHREYRLFCNIDYNAKGCARLPKCFTVDEREWGGQA